MPANLPSNLRGSFDFSSSECSEAGHDAAWGWDATTVVADEFLKRILDSCIIEID